MLAHAVVHAAAGDSLIRANGFATIPVTFIVSNFGSDGKSEPVMPMKFSHLQQGRELTADTAAIRIMAAAGFDPNALLRYIERTQPGSESGWEKLSSALPPRDARLANLNTSLEGLRGGAAPPSSSSFAAAQNSLRLATARIARPQKTPSLGQSY